MPAARRGTTPTRIQEALSHVRDQRSFLQALLIDALGWEVPEVAERIEDIAFGWSPEELRAAELTKHLIDGSVWQLQSLRKNQPWGIFILEFKYADAFTTGRGMAGPLRKVLRGLVPSRRKDAAAKSWRREHLLFICTHAYQHFRVAYFKSPSDKKTAAPLAAFGWGPDLPNRTACEYNLPELVWPDDPADSDAWVKHWAGAFDVERVTKKFYEEYATAFTEVEERIKHASGIKDDEDLRLFTQTLFNRLMFLRFIERKGWLEFGDRRDYLAAIMEAGGIGKRSAYQSRIRPLFFEGLAIEGRQQSPAIGRVPFLNGGLFEENDLDKQAKDVPDAAILPMIGPNRLFYRYNFTVEESTPLDIEVAVDPEMLGKVFERLVTGRHESGSYYTPKPIVSFMCREALKHYLATALAGEKADALAKLVDDHDASGLKNAEAVLAALRAVKVCDPACGSGAYLLGMLHELLELRTCLFVSKKVDAKTAYERKLEIIENNLYGVDIDEFAVNIARLRLWLSLAVEYDGDQPPPLPNLDFKIEAGDSLSAADPQAAFAGQAAFRDDLLKRFREKKAAFLEAHGDQKQRLKEEIEELRGDLATWLRSQAPEGAFDWATEFAEVFAPRPGEKQPGGFDIIVANPPYVRMELIKPLKPMLRKNFGYVHDERTDLYVYFYARAHELLRAGGVASFISSNKWLRAGYGEKLRQHLLDSQAFHLVGDFGELPVFQTAATFPAVFVWGRARRGDVATTWAVVKDLGQCYAEGVRQHVARVGQIVPSNQFGIGKSRLASTGTAGQRAKMEASGPRLAEVVGGTIGWGVKSGLNEAFVIDRATRDSLVKRASRSSEIIKSLLVGDDIRRYEVHDRDTYLIYAPHGTDIKRYPAIEDHLRPFRTQLLARATKQAWYELQQPQEAYVQYFEGAKILYPEIGKECRFVLDKTAAYPNNKAFFLPTADYFLLGVLNSASVFAFLKAVCSILGDEDEGGRLEFRAQYLEQVPIPEANSDNSGAVAKLAKGAQKLHGQRRKHVEAFLRACGIEPAESSSRNPLEQPWSLESADFTRRVKRGSLAVHSAARDETAALTAEIDRIEAEIDARVAALYGL
ncbi:MAG: DNA methyltransferase [Pirellulaceae bacterium]